MKDPFHDQDQICTVTNFQDLVSTPIHNTINALCWKRKLSGDFSEILNKLKATENITVIEQEHLFELELSDQGQLAREIIVTDFNLLKEHGAAPVLNLIKYYEEDLTYPFFPTDVYSFHVDRSPVPTSTFLCTYYGQASEIISNSQATQKIHVPEIRAELRKLFNGPEEDFDSFLTEHFFDLHYHAKPNADIINLGVGNLWRLAVDHPQSNSLPCIHRAPKEKAGESRLLMIC